jgi:hypothetical protein
VRGWCYRWKEITIASVPVFRRYRRSAGDPDRKSVAAVPWSQPADCSVVFVDPEDEVLDESRYAIASRR